MNNTMNHRVTLINFTATSSRIVAFLLSSLTICTIACLACLTPVAVGAVGAGYRAESITTVNVHQQLTTTFEPAYSHYARGAVVALVQVEAAQRISRDYGRGVMTDLCLQPKQVRYKSVGIT